MLKSIAVVLGSYLLSIVLVFATDPLLSLIFPGEFTKDHVPSNPALLASTACFVVVSILCAWLCAYFALRLLRSVHPPRATCSGSSSSEKSWASPQPSPTGASPGPTGTGYPGCSPGQSAAGSASSSPNAAPPSRPPEQLPLSNCP